MSQPQQMSGPLLTQAGLFTIAVAQVVPGTVRLGLFAVGLLLLFLPNVPQSLLRQSLPPGQWIFYSLLVAIAGFQAITTGKVIVISHMLALVGLLIVMPVLAPKVIAAANARFGQLLQILFFTASAIALTNYDYTYQVRSLVPVLALAIVTISVLSREVLRTLIIGSVSFIVLIFVWDSRAEAAAILAVIFSAIAFRTRGTARVLMLLIFICAIGAMFFNEFWISALRIDDAYRGLGTGLTGRIGGYIQAIDNVKQYPLFGIGYRREEAYFVGVNYVTEVYIYSVSSSHNGYLAMVQEWGAIGTLILLSPLLLAFRQFLHNARVSAAQPVLIGYLVFILFERFYLNFGNLYSIMIISIVVQLLSTPLRGDRGPLRLHPQANNGLSQVGFST